MRGEDKKPSSMLMRMLMSREIPVPAP